MSIRLRFAERSRLRGLEGLLSDHTRVFSSDINMGQTILLRLRPHFDPDAFFPEEDIVHTMLHEVSIHPLTIVYPGRS